jgi:hypothetical protein
MVIELNPRVVTRVMLWIVGVLCAAHVIQALFYLTGDIEYIGMLDLDIEANLPSMYSAAAIAFCSVLIFLIAIDQRRKQARGRVQWMILGFIFLFLVLDEAAAIHEELGDLVQATLDTGGIFYFAWVSPYMLGVLVLGMAFLKFVWQLPGDTRFQFIVAGLLFLTGAVGVELIGSWEADRHGTDTALYTALYTVEEFLEMIAMVVFANALLKFIGREIGTVGFRVGAGPGSGGGG